MTDFGFYKARKYLKVTQDIENAIFSKSYEKPDKYAALLGHQCDQLKALVADQDFRSSVEQIMENQAKPENRTMILDLFLDAHSFMSYIKEERTILLEAGVPHGLTSAITARQFLERELRIHPQNPTEIEQQLILPSSDVFFDHLENAKNEVCGAAKSVSNLTDQMEAMRRAEKSELFWLSTITGVANAAGTVFSYGVSALSLIFSALWNEQAKEI